MSLHLFIALGLPLTYFSFPFSRQGGDINWLMSMAANAFRIFSLVSNIAGPSQPQKVKPVQQTQVPDRIATGAAVGKKRTVSYCRKIDSKAGVSEGAMLGADSVSLRRTMPMPSGNECQ